MPGSPGAAAALFFFVLERPDARGRQSQAAGYRDFRSAALVEPGVVMKLLQAQVMLNPEELD
jgi:hypothetical protein